MRAIGLRLPILAMIILAVSSAPARAQEVLYLETADWIPTASVLAVPTSYVAAAAYVVPTSYVVPTVYATAYLTESAMVEPTAYLTPTYYETRFRRRGLFGRRLVETTRAYYIPTTAYYPTTYYYPTTFRSAAVVDTAVLPTVYATSASTACCGDVVGSTTVRDVAVVTEPAAIARHRRVRPHAPPGASRRPSGASRPRRSRSRRTCRSCRRERRTPVRRGTRQAHGPPPRPRRPRVIASSRPPPRKYLGESSPPSGRPLPPRAPPRRPLLARARPAEREREPGQPHSPRHRPDRQARRRLGICRRSLPPMAEIFSPPRTNEPTPQAGGQRRDSQKPVLTTPRTLRPELRNVLFGRVKARDTNEPEEGVRVSISNRQNTSESREALTDAFGRFAVRVPDGDWTVSVTMPSGRVYSVSQIIVSNGQITDEIGRDVPSLVITR